MPQTILQENMVELLGIDTLSVEEQAAFLSDVGELILETALVRLVSELSLTQQHSLDAYMDAKPEPEILLSHLLEHYKNFNSILENAIEEFKEDALAVLRKS